MTADPYLNTDAGTMSPFEHGEVFVLDDGGEVLTFAFSFDTEMVIVDYCQAGCFMSKYAYLHFCFLYLIPRWYFFFLL